MQLTIIIILSILLLITLYILKKENKAKKQWEALSRYVISPQYQIDKKKYEEEFEQKMKDICKSQLNN